MIKRSVAGCTLLAGLLMAAGCGGDDDGASYESCSVEESAEEVVITCPDGSEAVVANPEPAESEGCALTDHGDGSYTVDCEGSEPITLRDGERGEACEIEEGDGEVTLTCGEESVSFDVPACGNGLVEAGEVCDDGDDNGSCEFEDGQAVCTYCAETCESIEENTRAVIDGSVVSVRHGELGIARNLTLVVDGQEVAVDAEGKFYVEDLAPGTQTIAFEGGARMERNYGDRKRLAPQAMEVEVKDGQITPVVVRLMMGHSMTEPYDGEPLTFDFEDYSGSGINQMERDFEFELPVADMVVDESGDPFAGDLELTAYSVLSPTSDDDRWYYHHQAIPHPVSEDGDRLAISSAAGFELRDADTGDQLMLAGGESAQVRMVGGQGELGDNHRMWAFDHDQVRWAEGGEPTGQTTAEAITIYNGPTLSTEIYDGPIEELGWVAVAEPDTRQWTCVRGQVLPGAADIGANFEGGKTQASSDADGTFCIDVPQTQKVTLHGQVHRSAMERYFGGQNVDTSPGESASCGASVDDCIDVGQWELENLNGYCFDAEGMEVAPDFEADPIVPEGDFLQFRQMHHFDLPGDFYAQYDYGLEPVYPHGPVSLPAQTSCIPLYWRRPTMHLREEEGTELCENEWATSLRYNYGPFTDPQNGAMEPLCAVDNSGCYQGELSDDDFFCGS